MTIADYVDYLARLANTPAQDESLLYSQSQASGSIDLYVNPNKKELMCFKRKHLQAVVVSVLQYAYTA